MKKPKLWERMAASGEGPKAFDLLLAYFELGASRSLGKVAEESGRSHGLVSQLSAKFKWISRARAYDEHLLKIQQKAIENQVKIDAVLWAEREGKYRHEGFSLGDELIAKAKQMLASPLYETIVDKIQSVVVNATTGETVEVATKVIMRPVRWNFKDVVSMIDLADKMKRLSLGMPTSKTAVEVNWSEDPEIRLDWAKAAFKKYQENDLARVIERIMQDDPTVDPEQLRSEILAQAPIWFGDNWQVDPILITAGEDEEPPALSLALLEESTGVN